MITIVSALKAELRPFLDHFRADRKIAVATGSLYYGQQPIHFLRTGIGAEKAGVVLTHYLNRHQTHLLLNIGTAGALVPGIAMGTVGQIRRVTDEASGQQISLNDFSLPLPRFNLLTVHEAILDERRKQTAAANGAQLVDMEGFSLAKIATQREIPFLSVKIVSDHADEQAREQFVQNLEQLSRSLFRNVLPLIEQLQSEWVK